MLPAPESRDIVWPNVGIPLTQQKRRAMIGTVLCAWAILAWSVPVAGIQVITSGPELKKRFPDFVIWWQHHAPSAYAAIVGYLPVLALMGLLALLPYGLDLFAVRFEGRKTRSAVVQSVLFRNFYFQFFTLWVTVFSSSIMDSVTEVFARPECASQILGLGVPQVSVYFITFVIFRIGTTLPMVLFSPVASIGALKCLVGKQPDRLSCDFSVEVTNLAIVFTLASMYCLVAPIIMPICMVYFALAYGVYKWLFMNVYQSEFDSGGEMWSCVFLELMVGMFFSVLSLVGFTIIYTGNSAPWCRYAASAIPIILLIFGADCHFRLGRLAHSMPYEDAVAIDKDPAGVSTRSIFSSDYYRDPILDEAVEDLLEDLGDELVAHDTFGNATVSV
jgi:hypothetical protein